MNYPVVVRVDANAPIGMGHITRCHVLANALQERGLAPALFLTRDYSAAVEFLESRRLPYRILGAEMDFASECAEMRRTALDVGARVLLFDLLDVTEELVEKTCPEGVLSVVLLDHLDPPTIRKGLVFNHNVVYGASTHPTRSQQDYLAGASYVLLDPVFAEASRKSYFRESVSRLFLNQGGGDPFNLTTKILRALKPLRDQLKIEVVLGGAFAFDEELAPVLKHWGQQVTLHRMVPPAQVAALMMQAQMAHTAPGNMLYELLTLGVPSIAISHHEKHAAVAEFFAVQGAIEHLGIGVTLSEVLILERTRSLLHDEERRKSLHLVGRKIVDGLGAVRTADAILKALHGEPT